MHFSVVRARSGARRNDHGFTLIELLVVIAILAVLAGTVVFGVASAQYRAAAAACRAEAKMVITALEATRLTNVGHAYPGVAGPDGLDAVRAAGLLQWGDPSRFWAYVTPAAPSGLSDTDLVRTSLHSVDASDCHR